MATRTSPLDAFVSVRPAKFEVKLPNMPKLSEAISANGFKVGVEQHDMALEQWRVDAERQLQNTFANAVADAKAQIAAIPAPAPSVAASSTTTVVVKSEPGPAGKSGGPGPPGKGFNGYIGSMPLGSGVDGGSVTGLGLTFNPVNVVALSVSRPAGSLNITAHDVAGSLSADGFQFELSGMTDSALYVLNFMLT